MALCLFPFHLEDLGLSPLPSLGDLSVNVYFFLSACYTIQVSGKSVEEEREKVCTRVSPLSQMGGGCVVQPLGSPSLFLLSFPPLTNQPQKGSFTPGVVSEEERVISSTHTHTS